MVYENAAKLHKNNHIYKKNVPFPCIYIQKAVPLPPQGSHKCPQVPNKRPFIWYHFAKVMLFIGLHKKTYLFLCIFHWLRRKYLHRPLLRLCLGNRDLFYVSPMQLLYRENQVPIFAPHDVAVFQLELAEFTLVQVLIVLRMRVLPYEITHIDHLRRMVTKSQSHRQIAGIRCVCDI